VVNVRLKNIRKSFGKTLAVNRISLNIKDKEFFTLLGPSGCGKTTTLRIIAGLLEPDEGEIYFGERLMNKVPPEKRNVTMVFQNFALFPHMTVYDNIAFGLKMRKWSKNDIDRRVKEIIQMLHLEGQENKYPHQLSGGQQQRVGLARALAPEPDLILFDEPLSNLDAILRERIRFELRELVKKVGITSIYVTHDQAEALVVSDRIAVMRDGKIIQTGSPLEVYEKPNSAFVANFLGIASLISGKVEEIDKEGYYVFTTDEGVTYRAKSSYVEKLGDKGIIVIRPEHVVLHKYGESIKTINVVEGIIGKLTFLGSTIDVRVRVGNQTIRTFLKSGELKVSEGEKILVEYSPEKLVIIPASS